MFCRIKMIFNKINFPKDIRYLSLILSTFLSINCYGHPIIFQNSIQYVSCSCQASSGSYGNGWTDNTIDGKPYQKCVDSDTQGKEKNLYVEDPTFNHIYSNPIQ